MRHISNRRILKSKASDLAKLALYKLMFSGCEGGSLDAELSEYKGDGLLCLSEIKQTDKSTEIKYVDRIKAASLMIELARLEGESEEASDSFFKRFKAAADEINELSDRGEDLQ